MLHLVATIQLRLEKLQVDHNFVDQFQFSRARAKRYEQLCLPKMKRVMMAGGGEGVIVI